jgi:hypothetical protein
VSTFEWVLIAVVFVLAGLLSWLLYGHRIRTKIQAIKVHRELLQVKREQKRIAGKNLADPELDIAAPRTREALVIDVENPPTWKVYSNPYKAGPPCSCHGRPFKYGDKVMMWPIPGHPEGGIDLYCEETFQEAKNG